MDRNRVIAVGICALLLACVGASPTYAPQDLSIVFPPFADADVVRIDAAGVRAIQVATEDFFPRHRQLRQGLSELEKCIYSPSSLDYMVVPRGGVTFVRLQMNPKHCGGHGAVADSGASYAVDTTGRILRRLVDGEPDLVSAPPAVPGREDLRSVTDGGTGSGCPATDGGTEDASFN